MASSHCHHNGAQQWHDGLTGNQMIQSEYRLVAMACAYFLEQRKKVKPNLKLMALLDLHMNHGSRCWAIPCCYVDCMKCFKVQGKFIPCSSKQQWHPALTPHNGIQHGTTSRLSKCGNGTLPRNPAMAPRPVCQSVITIPRLLRPAMAPSNGTLPHGTQQWHLTMAPSNGTTSSRSTCVITAPR